MSCLTNQRLASSALDLKPWARITTLLSAWFQSYKHLYFNFTRMLDVQKDPVRIPLDSVPRQLIYRTTPIPETPLPGILSGIRVIFYLYTGHSYTGHIVRYTSHITIHYKLGNKI